MRLLLSTISFAIMAIAAETKKPRLRGERQFHSNDKTFAAAVANDNAAFWERELKGGSYREKRALEHEKKNHRNSDRNLREETNFIYDSMGMKEHVNGKAFVATVANDDATFWERELQGGSYLKKHSNNRERELQNHTEFLKDAGDMEKVDFWNRELGKQSSS